MPAKNPRLTITLEPTLAAHLRRLSELTGNSQSKLIADMLEGSIPVFERLIRVLEAADTAKQSIKGKVAEDMGDAQARIEKQLGLVLEEFDGSTRPLLEEVERVKRRAARATASAARRPGRAAVPTPPSNRGVRSTANPEKTEGKRGAKRGPI